jgi:hypothetical protein
VLSAGSDADLDSDFSSAALDLANFERGPEGFSIGQEPTDPAAVSDLKQPGSVSLSVSGLESEDSVTSEASAAKAASKTADQRRRGSKQRRGSNSAWQQIDRVRGGVEGLIRHFF